MGIIKNEFVIKSMLRSWQLSNEIYNHIYKSNHVCVCLIEASANCNNRMVHPLNGMKNEQIMVKINE